PLSGQCLAGKREAAQLIRNGRRWYVAGDYIHRAAFQRAVQGANRRPAKGPTMRVRAVIRNSRELEREGVGDAVVSSTLRQHWVSLCRGVKFQRSRQALFHQVRFIPCRGRPDPLPWRNVGGVLANDLDELGDGARLVYRREQRIARQLQQ